MKSDIFQTISILVVLLFITTFLWFLSPQASLLLIGLLIGVMLSEVRYHRTKMVNEKFKVEQVKEMQPKEEQKGKEPRVAISGTPRIVGRAD